MKKLSAFFKRINKQNIKKFFREQILDNQESNLKLALAIGLGFFMSVLPIWGLQMLVAVFLAALFRLNKLIVLVAANMSLPPLIPFIIYLSFILGGFLIDQSAVVDFNPEFSFDNIKNDLFQYYLGGTVLASLLGFTAALLSYLLLMILRKSKLKSKKEEA